MSRTQSAGSNLQEVVLTNNPYATRVTEEEARRKAVEAEFLRHNPLKQQPIGGAKIEQKLEERQTNMNDKGKKSMIGSPVHTEVGKSRLSKKQVDLDYLLAEKSTNKTTNI
ncbi:hypothetical protein A1F94_006264 [Pyrenophora tritici-repentis]|nr:hypothetical protein PtrV1_13417 [Pyrenophora tritici-repentis]KAG9382343.1 hypothetical protein A1F94_006264 [Pyrenophora tritici-repentis]